MRWLFVLLVVPMMAFADKKPLATVAHVDLTKYAGKWYEIARYPNTFERKCVADVTAEYTLRDDGKVTVKNSCRKDNGKRTESTGTAKIVDTQTNAKLKVTFFWPFYGDYWIVDLAPDYSYAVVSEPDRKYLWILSRTPHMPQEQYEKITRWLTESGFDPEKLVQPPQAPESVSGR